MLPAPACHPQLIKRPGIEPSTRARAAEVLGVGMSYTKNCSIAFDAGALPVLVKMLGSRDPDERM